MILTSSEGKKIDIVFGLIFTVKGNDTYFLRR
jgi:hypothetical protein